MSRLRLLTPLQGATDAAREAASVVIIEGDFSALVLALREGRRLYDNLVHVSLAINERQ